LIIICRLRGPACKTAGDHRSDDHARGGCQWGPSLSWRQFLSP